ncbi:HIT domain-containing protein [Candidatus Dojkabacteria bacterium]|nr:HIT domain-containing protein [Candidatus Dojkabacteria bacterium]
MDDCIFCKIVKGEIPSFKIIENENFAVILDAFPRIEGQVLVISKEHISSNFDEVPDEILKKGILIAKTISSTLRKSLNSPRVLEIIEGLDVDHMHIKLYPLPTNFSGGLHDLLNSFPAPDKILTSEEGKKVLDKITGFVK